MTEVYLKQLNDYVKANNAELIVVVIPAADDLKEKEAHYLNAIKILNGLSIPHVENINLLNNDNYLKAGGGHWKNSGHIIAGHALSKYLVEHIKEKQQKTFKKKLGYFPTGLSIDHPLKICRSLDTEKNIFWG